MNDPDDILGFLRDASGIEFPRGVFTEDLDEDAANELIQDFAQTQDPGWKHAAPERIGGCGGECPDRRAAASRSLHRASRGGVPRGGIQRHGRAWASSHDAAARGCRRMPANGPPLVGLEAAWKRNSERSRGLSDVTFTIRSDSLPDQEMSCLPKHSRPYAPTTS